MKRCRPYWVKDWKEHLSAHTFVHFSQVTHTLVHFSQLTHTLLHFSLLTATYPFLICNVNLCLVDEITTLKNFRHGPPFWLVMRNFSVVACLNRKEQIKNVRM